ncbi:unnamed protein product, partial [Polarella glacialis]
AAADGAAEGTNRRRKKATRQQGLGRRAVAKRIRWQQSRSSPPGTFAEAEGGEMWLSVQFVVAGLNYPAVANSVEDALYWVSELVSNSSLRVALREQGLRLAEPYALDSLSQRLALILADVVSRPRK